VIALLIIGQAAGGLYMHNLPNNSAIKFDLYQLHKSFGVTILLLTVLRLAWRLGHKPPPLPAAMAGWEKFAARATHVAFYALLVITPLAGWAMVSVSPTDIPTKIFGVISLPHMPFFEGVSDRAAVEDVIKEVHEYLAFTILGLLALHVGAALKHHFVNKDQVMSGMAPRSVFETGAISILLAALLGAAAWYWSAPAGVSASPAIIAPGAVASDGQAAGAWIVDKAASRLIFIAEEKGRRFEGAFSNFDATIVFDPDNLEASRIDVVVAAGSARTGDELRDANLPGGEWFDAGDYPAASFASDDIVETGDGAYEARGRLTIKDFEKDIILPFTLAIEDNEARAEGEVQLIRTDFGLGADAAWLDEEAIALEVTVRVEITAQRGGQ